MKKHAVLSASSSHKWIMCPPSARLEAEQTDLSTEYAAEGTDAHTLCEYKLKKLLGEEADDPTEKLNYYNAEMEECAEGYALFVAEELEKVKETCADPVVLIEQKLDFSRWVPEGFGTGDCVICADGRLTVIDFKYGAGVQVEAAYNPQMMCYALGAMGLFNALYDIDTVKLCIYQPRKDNLSIFEMTPEELLDWAKLTLAPAAELAFEGKGELYAGEHCKFCKVKAQCRARAELNLELAKHEFKEPYLLEDNEIAEILKKVDELVSWGSAVKDYALEQAKAGKKFEGWKLVSGRSNRKYKDEAKVAKAVGAAGYSPYAEPKVLTITEMTKMLGKKKFEEILGELIIKPQGKPVLVPEDDKRPELNNIKDDFIQEDE